MCFLCVSVIKLMNGAKERQGGRKEGKGGGGGRSGGRRSGFFLSTWPCLSFPFVLLDGKELRQRWVTWPKHSCV